MRARRRRRLCGQRLLTAASAGARAAHWSRLPATCRSGRPCCTCRRACLQALIAGVVKQGLPMALRWGIPCLTLLLLFRSGMYRVFMGCLASAKYVAWCYCLACRTSDIAMHEAICVLKQAIVLVLLLGAMYNEAHQALKHTACLPGQPHVPILLSEPRGVLVVWGGRADVVPRRGHLHADVQQLGADVGQAAGGLLCATCPGQCTLSVHV